MANALPEYLELVMRFIPVLIMIAIPVALFIARKRIKNETEKAKNTAGMLGLRYINVAEEMKQSKPNDSFLLGLFSGWSPWAMEGTHNGVPVRVELTVKAKQNRYIPYHDRVSVSNPTRTSYSRGTTYVASFEKSLPFDISIHKKVNMPFGLQQFRAVEAIETGDEELDNALEISGEDKSKIENWLKSVKIKDALKNVYESIPSVSINSDGLFLYDRYSKADYHHLKNNLRLLSEAVVKIQKV